MDRHIRVLPAPAGAEANWSRPERAGRPWTVQIKMQLYPSEDDDLLGFFGSIPPRLWAAMVKRALREGAGSVDLLDLPKETEIMEALEALVM